MPTMSIIRKQRLRRGASLVKPLVFAGLLTAVVLVAAGFAFRRSKSAKLNPSFLTHTARLGSLDVKVTADGTLESSENIEIKCNVKGGSTVLWVIETGTLVKPGDILVELDRSQIEDNVLVQEIAYETARAKALISESDVTVAQTSIVEYTEGKYQEEKATIEKQIFDAEQAVTAAELSYQSATRLAAKGVLRATQLQGEKFSLDAAKKELQLARTKLDALEKYTREKTLQELESALSAAQATYAADKAALALEKQRLERERQQLENCTIRSTGSGLVIFPSAAAWKDTPDIEEGAVVREQQTLLMIPDLSKMQVKVGIHESKVERLQPGMTAKVQMQSYNLEGTVESIAEVTRPAGWWTGNMVKYDTIVRLQPREGLKPGMSAIVEITLAHHENVLTIPVASMVEVGSQKYCWVVNKDGVERRTIVVGDTNDEFTIVQDGLKEGDIVVLSPLSQVEEAQQLVGQSAGEPTREETGEALPVSEETAETSKS